MAVGGVVVPTAGPENDRVVPWLGPTRSLPSYFLLYVALFALLRSWVGDDAGWWAAVPTLTGVAVVAGFCGRRKDGSKVRYRVLAVTAFCILLAAVSFVGVWLFPAAGHTHPGPLRGLVYLIATVVAVYAFAAVTHWRLRAVAEDH